MLRTYHVNMRAAVRPTAFDKQCKAVQSSERRVLKTLNSSRAKLTVTLWKNIQKEMYLEDY